MPPPCGGFLWSLIFFARAHDLLYYPQRGFRSDKEKYKMRRQGQPDDLVNYELTALLGAAKADNTR
jgi:hypothetical protein